MEAAEHHTGPPLRLQQDHCTTGRLQKQLLRTGMRRHTTQARMHPVRCCEPVKHRSRQADSFQVSVAGMPRAVHNPSAVTGLLHPT
jgi:hypothetical protein